VQKMEAASGKNGDAGTNNPAKIADHDLVLKDAVVEREEMLRMSDFLRRSITTVISLVDLDGTADAVSENLTSFRRAVQTGGPIEDLQKSLDVLKSAIIASPRDGVSTSPSAGVRQRADSAGRYAAQGGCQIADDTHLQMFKSIFLGIIAEFDQDLGEDYANQLGKLRKGIMAGEELDSLTVLKKDLLACIQTYNRNMNEERNQITDFISEIESNLMDIERQFQSWMTHSGQTGYTANRSFNNLIEGHMEDMNRSAQVSTTLAEFRSLVISRLASIREALAHKRKAEELREETVTYEMENLQQNLQKMKKEIDQVQEKRKALEKEILIDQLTGIANRRALKQRLKEELQRFHRYGQNFSVLLFDIDHFKGINDRFGHWAGDKVLKELIKRIKPMLRETDFIARWGGEEFVVLFPGTEIESAMGVAERLRKAIEHTRFIYQRQEIGVTISIGVTEVVPEDQHLETIFNRTDKAMYVAKKKGRNLVVKA